MSARKIRLALLSSLAAEEEVEFVERRECGEVFLSLLLRLPTALSAFFRLRSCLVAAGAEPTGTIGTPETAVVETGSETCLPT